MGTPEFAVPSLRALAAAHDVVAVYTRPDAVSGRGGAVRPSAVKAVATELGMRVVQPRSLRDTAEQAEFAAHAPDLCVVAAYGLILPREVLDAPALGCVNVHASLLPRWRGAAPIQRAILAGDPVTGVSIMRMEEGLDTGPFCVVETVDVDDKTAPQLTEELARAGAAALLRALPLIESGTCEWTEQVEADATYAEKIAKPEVVLAPTMTAAEALRRVRASSPSAPARARIAEKNVTVTLAQVGPEKVDEGGVVLSKEGIALGTSNGTLLVLRVKPDGKQEMQAADWGRGLRLSHDATWERA